MKINSQSYFLFLFLTTIPLELNAQTSNDTTFLNTEWMDKIYQSNRLLETVEVSFRVFDGNENLKEFREIVWDNKNKRIVNTSRILSEKPLQQRVSKLFLNDTKCTNISYSEKTGKELLPTSSEIKEGNCSIYTVDPQVRNIRMFFIFDDNSWGEQFTKILKTAPNEEIKRWISEVQFREKKCLRFKDAGSYTFEKERGIVLEKTLYGVDEHEKPYLAEKVEYFDHQFIDGIWFPLTVKYTSYSPDTKDEPNKWTYRVKAENVRINHKIPKEKFIPTIPKGFEVFDGINDLSYISTGFSTERENSIKKQLDEIFTQSEK